MRFASHRSAAVANVSLLLISAAVAAIHAQDSASPKLAEQQFKNIQVLKGVPADQIFPAMQFITASLGVECDHCHVREGRDMKFDKDDKKAKVTARKMMQMMFAINKDNFDGKREVTCYSCHRGAADPLSTPIITEDEPKLIEAKKSDAPPLPSADVLLDKYLSAVGGAEALQKITSRVEKGTLVAFRAQRNPVEIYTKSSGKRISIMHLPGGDSVTAFDGRSGWLSFQGHAPHFMSPAENDAARLDADLLFPLHVKSLYQKFTVAPGEKIDGRDTFLVTGRSEGQPLLRLYLDSQSGVLLREVRYAETPLGRNPTQIDYADYRDADGVKVPFRWTLSRPGNRFTIQIDQLQQNVPVDDAKFTPPPALPEPAKPAGH